MPSGCTRTPAWQRALAKAFGCARAQAKQTTQRATLVVILNTDITYAGQEPSSLVARAVTEIVTPDNVYDRPSPSN
jgi:hypothetical protein